MQIFSSIHLNKMHKYNLMRESGTSKEFTIIRRGCLHRCSPSLRVQWNLQILYMQHMENITCFIHCTDQFLLWVDY